MIDIWFNFFNRDLCQKELAKVNMELEKKTQGIHLQLSVIKVVYCIFMG